MQRSPRLPILTVENLPRAQGLWDRFFRTTLKRVDHINPDLRRDRALDRTIRALGQRPRKTPNTRELEEGMLRIKVELLIAASAKARNHGRCVIPRAVDGRAL